MILWEWGLPLTAEISGANDSRTAGEETSGEDGELHSCFVDYGNSTAIEGDLYIGFLIIRNRGPDVSLPCLYPGISGPHIFRSSHTISGSVSHLSESTDSSRIYCI